MSDATWATLAVAWMLTYLVHSTIFIGAAWAITRFVRRHPEVMCGVWKVALLGGVLTASVQLGLGVSPLGGSVALPASGASLESFSGPAAVKVEAGAPSAIETSTSAADLLAISYLDARETTSAGTAPDPVDDSTAAGTATWIIAMAWLVLLGGAVGALSVLRAAIGLRRRLARRAPARGELRDMLHDLMRRARCARRVGLSLDARTSMPLATGVVHPEIVLPDRVQMLDAEQQRPMLAHELAHVVRHDPTWRLLALLVERVLFIQPLNRIASDRMAACAELASDDWAARHTNEPLALARCLTEVASWLPRPDLQRTALASPMAASSQLRDRVMRLLDPERPAPPRKGIGVVAACLLAGVAWAAPGVSAGDVLRGPVPAVQQSWLGGAVDRAAPDEVEIAPSAAVVWTVSTEGHTVPTASMADAADAPESRPARRKAKRRVAKANRNASRELRAAMREARREGQVAPSRAEIDRIVAKAELEAGRAPVPPTRHDGEERFELRIELPDGSLHLEVRGSSDERVARHHERRPQRAHRPPGHRAKPVPHPFGPGKAHPRKRGRPWGHHEVERARKELRRELERGELPREVYEQVERMLDRVERSLERAGQHDVQRIDPPFGPGAPVPPAGPRSRHRRPTPPAAPPSPPEGVQWTL
jgi:beta-lactamase regulating signal transducer with metallopeptidase domain